LGWGIFERSPLRYATPSFTLSTYCHTSERMMQDTAKRMQSYYDTLAEKGQKIL
jgi:hypothetical protein